MKFLICFSLFCIAAHSANAQRGHSDDKSLVVYDPLLWKHELKLSADQRQKIQQINLEFYQSIYETVNEETTDHVNLQSKANQYLQHRSEAIWNAFTANQRRKWKRMWNQHAI